MLHQRNRLSQSIQLILLSTSLLTISTWILAAPTASIKNIEISAGNLDQALAQFAGLSGVQLAYDPALVAGQKTSGLKGQYTFEEGIAKLLNGTGLQLLKRNDGTWLIVKSHNQVHEVGTLENINIRAAPSEQQQNNGSAQLPVIAVKANNKNTEGTGSYTAKSSSTSTKLDLSPRETPQTVKVITREYLDDKNITSFTQLMDQVTGVNLGRIDARAIPSSRGFSMNYMLFDGNPLGGADSSMDVSDPNLVIFDRVEIVKGANGLMTGAGNPSMGMNFIRKRANAKELTGSLDMSVGSWDDYSSSADLSFPLSQDGSIRGRTVVNYQDKDSFQDVRSTTNKTAYGVVDMDLTDTTYLSVGISYQDLVRNGITWGSLPAFYSDGTRTDFKRSSNIGDDWTERSYRRTAVYTDFKQELFNNISFNLNSVYGKSKTWGKMYGAGAPIDKETDLSTKDSNTSARYNNDNDLNIDGSFKIPFKLFGLEQEAIIGASFNQYEVEDDYSAAITLTHPKENFNHLNDNPIISIAPYKRSPANKVTQNATYFAGKFSLLESLKLIAGTRLSNWKYEQDNNVGNREFNNQLTPYFGVIYDLNQNHSIYASYTDIFSPQNRKDVSGQYLDPIIGKQYETGIKSGWFSDHLNTSLSIFKIQQDNVAEAIDGVYVPNTTEQAYRGVNGVESKGIELEIDGEITDNWNLNFGIANFEAKDQKGNKINTNQARTTANLFTKYKWNQLSVGGGLSYKSKFYNEVAAFNQRVEQNAYVLANVMLAYDIDQNIKTQLNINNLFDKTYYECVGSSICYGTPRNITLSLRYNF
ncbi:TonB-dependent receptor [Acinetobacter sp. ANC 3882]|uniref:TonB-dependent siderophore receptor n=1 Tax=Acinetobacter sp. ANC 3882 TaxID=2923423 RepID=UPI001F4B94D2|nr:TonB-dependent receptor [Acinetobacter sp. ANC 3882]MCH7315028.1 TonB-dependent receptor [Acinetobacter sp. ANC 3882]